MTKIKICGLSRPEDIEMVNEALPDYIGFVFAKSKRQITEETAKRLKNKLSPSVRSVGVFVNEEPEHILRLCKDGVIDIIQLHGDEDLRYLEFIRREVEHPIIKAIRVRKKEDISQAGSYPVDYLLLDAYHEGSYGGCGESFDWNMIEEIKKPYFLAGGINARNVTDAISRVHPFAVDISSGVETNGYKDRDKINQLMKKIRASY